MCLSAPSRVVAARRGILDLRDGVVWCGVLRWCGRRGMRFDGVFHWVWCGRATGTYPRWQPEAWRLGGLGGKEGGPAATTLLGSHADADGDFPCLEQGRHDLQQAVDFLKHR